MFALRGVINSLGYGAESQVAELAKIESGEFYLTRRDKLRGGRQCIYPKAMLSVSKTSVPFNFQLTISRVYEEGDANILDEDEEDDADEKSFLIGVELGLQTYTFEGRPAFSWRDVQAADPDDRFEFVVDKGTSKSKRDSAERAILQAVYERKFMKSSAGVSDKELKAVASAPLDDDSSDDDEAPVRPAKGGKGKAKAASRSPEPGLADAMSSMSLSASTSKSAPSPAKSSPAKAPPPPAETEEHPALVSEVGDLYLWDFASEQFNLIEEEVAAKVVDAGGDEKFNYWLIVSDGANKMLGHKVSVDQSAKWSLPDLSVSWINPDGPPPYETWVMAFSDVLKFDSFKKTYQQCLWEVKNREPWGKAANADQTYALKTWNGYAEYDMQDPSDEEEEDREKSEEETTEDEDDDADEEGVGHPEEDHFTNSALVVGHNHPRAFVVRGTKIGVFSTEGDRIAYETTMKDVKTMKGKSFIPDQVMLHNQDASMILTNPNDPHSLYRVDLGERGEVVEEWKVHDDISINNITPNSKFAPTTHAQPFLGTSNNALFRVDPRVSGSKLVESESKQYATKARFSSLATTQHGKVVVGSAKGDLRFFDTVGKIAKTALPALGDPVIGVDTTADGRWVVATTKTALLVFDMTIPDNVGSKFAGSLGFDRAFPADAKPLAKRLMLSSQHAAYMGGVNFTPARFNTGPDQVEKTIVTSSGAYVIAWDFDRIKKGKLDKYEIKMYGDEVIQDNFLFGHSNDIVVALRDNVIKVDKKQLKKPTRSSLGAPTRTRPSRG